MIGLTTAVIAYSTASGVFGDPFKSLSNLSIPSVEKSVSDESIIPDGFGDASPVEESPHEDELKGGKKGKKKGSKKKRKHRKRKTPKSAVK